MSSLLNYSSLVNCRRLFVRNLLVNMKIGAYEREKGVLQRVRFQVDLFVPIKLSTPVRDELNETVNTDLILEAIEKSVGNDHTMLQETVCDQIAVRLLVADTRVLAVRVVIEKVDAYENCDGVGVEVFRMR